MAPASAAASQPPQRTGLRAFLGLAPEGPDADGAMRCELELTDAIRQPIGLLHGGVHAVIGESLAVDGTLALTGRTAGARAITTQTSFLRPVTKGSVHAVARPRHRGRTTWVWEIELSDDAQRLCCLVRATIALGD